MKEIICNENLTKDIFIMNKTNQTITSFQDFKHPSRKPNDDDDMEKFIFFSMIGDILNVLEQICNLTSDLEIMKNKICYMFQNPMSEIAITSLGRDYFDMRIVYYIPFKGIGNDEYVIIRVSEELANKLSLSENQIYELAKRNTPNIFPLKTVETLLLKESINRTIFKEDVISSVNIYTNQIEMHGSISILYDNAFNHLKENIAILPINTHDSFVLTTSKNICKIKEELGMIYKRLYKDSKEFFPLSQKILTYDKESQEIKEVK